MKVHTKYLIPFLLICVFFIQLPLQVHAQNEQPITAVLFVSTACPHCHNVLENTIKPLIKGGQTDLNVILVNISNGGYDIFLQTVDALNVPANLRGTPLLVIGDTYMVGDQQIPTELENTLLEAKTNPIYLQPQVAVLKDSETILATAGVLLLNASNIDTLSEDGSFSEVTEKEGLVWGWESPLIAATMLLLLATIVFQIITLKNQTPIILHRENAGMASTIFNLLLLVGIGIATYLSYTEIFNKETICLGYSGCDTVQKSAYSRIFGIIPVALAGLLCYLTLAGLSIYHQKSTTENTFLKKYIPMIIMVILTFNNFFLLGLNTLELVILKALCIWCLAFAFTNILLSWQMMIEHQKHT